MSKKERKRLYIYFFLFLFLFFFNFFLLQAPKSFSHSPWLSALYVMPLLNQNSMLNCKMDLICRNYIMMNTFCQIRNN